VCDGPGSRPRLRLYLRVQPSGSGGRADGAGLREQGTRGRDGRAFLRSEEHLRPGPRRALLCPVRSGPDRWGRLASSMSLGRPARGGWLARVSGRLCRFAVDRALREGVVAVCAGMRVASGTREGAVRAARVMMFSVPDARPTVDARAVSVGVGAALGAAAVTY